MLEALERRLPLDAAETWTAAACLPSPSVPAGSTVEVYYDYIEDGVLKGGRIGVEASSAATSVAATASPPPWNVETVIDNGSPSNRIDLAIVGDGYRTSDLGIYASHVSNLLTSFFAESPLNAYATLFNVHRVDVISTDSGVDNDPTLGVTKNTALDMNFWCGGIDRLLCVDIGKASAAASSAPQVDHILAVANSAKYGGAGYKDNDVLTVSGGSSSSLQIALHEFGHSFADLADEYHYGDGTRYTGSERIEPNVSIQAAAAMESLQTKWYRWLPAADVDTYEGAYYAQYGIFRPTFNSKMRTLGMPFGPVNSEQFVLNIYKLVRPIDAATPAGTYPDSQLFHVDPVDPTTHALAVQWSLNGVVIPGANHTTLDAFTLNLAPGDHVLSVRVVDETPLVRDHAARAQWMTQELSWTVQAAPRAEVPAVAGMAPTHTGFTVAFTRPMDASVLSLIDLEGGAYGPSDAVLVDSTGAIVAGSLVVDEDLQKVTFIKTGGTLPPNTYTLVLRSADDGFRDLEGNLLDGDNDGLAGGDYTAAFTVAPPASGAVTVAVTDVVRGPGQPLGEAAFGGGLPLTVDNAAGVLSIEAVLHYDPTLLALNGVSLAPDAPEAVSIYADLSVPGRLQIRFDSAEPMAAGPAQLAIIAAAVPPGAPYGSAHLLDLADILVNGGQLGAIDDDAVHVAVFLGDATGNGVYSGLDAQRIARVVVGLDGGFEPYPLLDAAVIADTTGDGTLSGLDAVLVAQFVVGLSPAQIPSLPHAQPPPSATAGPEGEPGGLRAGATRKPTSPHHPADAAGVGTSVRGTPTGSGEIAANLPRRATVIPPRDPARKRSARRVDTEAQRAPAALPEPSAWAPLRPAWIDEIFRAERWHAWAIEGVIERAD